MSQTSARIFALTLMLAAMILLSVSDSIAEPIIYLIRHAEQTDQKLTDPPLSDMGHARAEWYGGHFTDLGVATIFSSPYLRTRETAKPLADALGLKIIEYNPRELATFAHELKTLEGIILVSGHSNTTPALVNALVGEERFQQLQHFQFDHIFRVTWADDGEVRVTLSYSEPRSVNGDDPSER